MGGRPRDEDVKDEPDEDEAAMLGEGSSRGLQSPETAIRGLGRGWRRSYHGTGTGHARGSRQRLAARQGLRELPRAKAGCERAAGCRHALAVRTGDGEAGSLRMPGIGRMEEGLGG